MHSLREKLPELLRSENKSSLARALGISRSTLARYQKDPYSMPLVILKRVADLRGYTVRLDQSETSFTI